MNYIKKDKTKFLIKMLQEKDLTIQKLRNELELEREKVKLLERHVCELNSMSRYNSLIQTKY